MSENRVFPRILLLTAISLLAAGALWGGYVVFKKFLQDRQRTSNFTPPKTTIRRQNPQGTQVHRYTPEELEKARKEGKLPPGLKQPPPTNHTNLPGRQAGDAVQRSLKTIQEINRINEMNRRLMEQQQRMQNQKP